MLIFFMNRRQFLQWGCAAAVTAGLGYALVPKPHPPTNPYQEMYIPAPGFVRAAKQRLDALLDAPLDEVSKNASWELMHRMLARGEFDVDGQSVVDRIMDQTGIEFTLDGQQYPDFNGVNPRTHHAFNGISAATAKQMFESPPSSQGHIDQFLMAFAESGLPLDRLITVKGIPYTIHDLVEGSQRSLDLDHFDADAGWTLHAYANYVGWNTSWKTAAGKETNLGDLFDRVAQFYEDQSRMHGKPQPDSHMGTCYNAHVLNGLLHSAYAPGAPVSTRERVRKIAEEFLFYDVESQLRQMVSVRQGVRGFTGPSDGTKKEFIDPSGHWIEVAGNIAGYNAFSADPETEHFEIATIHALLKEFATEFMGRDPTESRTNFKREWEHDHINYSHLIGIYSHAMNGLNRLEKAGYF